MEIRLLTEVNLYAVIQNPHTHGHGWQNRSEHPHRSGFWFVVRIFGPVHNTDFGSDLKLVQSLVRTFVRTRTLSGTRYGFWSKKSATGRLFFSPVRVKKFVKLKIIDPVRISENTWSGRPWFNILRIQTNFKTGPNNKMFWHGVDFLTFWKSGRIKF